MRRLTAAVLLLLSPVFLLAGRLPGLSSLFDVLRGLPREAALGYEREPGGFAPLSAAYLSRLYGDQPPDRAAGSARAGSRRGGIGPVSEGPETRHDEVSDSFDNAVEAHRVPFESSGDTRPATRQAGEPSSCSPAGGTVWYRYAPPVSTSLIANTFGTSYATAVGVFTGSRLDDMTLVSCDTDVKGNSQAGFRALARQLYFFQVTGPAGGGDLIFTVEPLGTPSLVSLSTSGQQANEWSESSSISADGRHVAFVSWATNLVPGLRQAPCPSVEGTYFHSGTSATRYIHRGKSTTACPLVFVRDRLTRTTRLVSMSSSGQQANDASVEPSISADGRFIAFHSLASNLVGSDTNGVNDVFVHDVVTRRTSRVSVSSSGEEARDDETPFWWGDGSGSSHPSISSNGRYVAFQSLANNLVPGDTNGFLDKTNIAGMDVFIHDRAARETKRVSMSSTGMSSGQGDWYSHSPDISSDGKYVAFASGQDTGANGIDLTEIFVQALDGGATSRVSVSSSGERGNSESASPRLSGDGRFVLFHSEASNLVAGDANARPDIFVRDLVGRTTTRVSVSSSGDTRVGDRLSAPWGASVSADGRYVAFISDANELDPGEGETRGRLQLFLHDRLTHTTILISVSAAGEQGNNGSNLPSISADGKIVAFESGSSNLVAGDTNDTSPCTPGGGCSIPDVFVFERP